MNSKIYPSKRKKTQDHDHIEYDHDKDESKDRDENEKENEEDAQKEEPIDKYVANEDKVTVHNISKKRPKLTIKDWLYK